MCKEWIKRFEPDPCYKQQIKLSLLGKYIFSKKWNLGNNYLHLKIPSNIHPIFSIQFIM